jgi:putative endonuclease
MRGGWVYIMTSRPNGTLYTGVTADISRRAYEHREGLCEGFTKRYRLTRLVWYEFHDGIPAAIQRERNMKHWPRAWKVRLVLAMNPEWRDLYLDGREAARLPSLASPGKATSYLSAAGRTGDTRRHFRTGLRTIFRLSRRRAWKARANENQ